MEGNVLFDMWKEEGKGMIFYFFYNFVFSLWSG